MSAADGQGFGRPTESARGTAAVTSRDLTRQQLSDICRYFPNPTTRAAALEFVQALCAERDEARATLVWWVDRCERISQVLSDKHRYMLARGILRPEYGDGLDALAKAEVAT